MCNCSHEIIGYLINKILPKEELCGANLLSSTTDLTMVSTVPPRPTVVRPRLQARAKVGVAMLMAAETEAAVATRRRKQTHR
jgi:hypothetical protein